MKLKTYTSPKIRPISLDNQNVFAASPWEGNEAFSRKMDWEDLEDTTEKPYGFHSDNYWEE